MRLHLAPHARDRRACRRLHRVPQRADVATFAAGTKTDEDIVEMMIGREYRHVFPPLPGGEAPCPPCADRPEPFVDGAAQRRNLDLVPGEVVGLGGLDGQGQRNFLLALFGVLIGVTGTVEIDGKSVKVSNPHALQERRHRYGAHSRRPEERGPDARDVGPGQSLVRCHRRVQPLWRRRPNAESAAIDDIIQLLQIRSDGVDGPVAALSGGNQQKVVIGKWLMTQPRIILLNDPTRGIDVGTKQELYQLLRRLADDGAAILFYSTDYDELIGCCDRVLVFYNGAIERDALGAELNERNLISARSTCRRRTPPRIAGRRRLTDVGQHSQREW